MENEFEKFVGVELPKRISTKDDPLKVTKGKIPVSTGSGLSTEFKTVEEVALQGKAGKSAYEIAVENGFVGTETEWNNDIKNTYAIKKSIVSSFGDFFTKDLLIIACGDSTTEQFNQNNGGSQMVQTLRQQGEVWENIKGFINFGGSGYTLKGFVEDPVQTLPKIPETGVAEVSNWDTYGHKPTGAISLATALEWRNGKAVIALWRICYGINDMILYNVVGNLALKELTEYLADYLRKAIKRIMERYPQDYILIECPNPMTARPFVAPGPGFPSYKAYPTFGADLSVDAALVDKWNWGVRQAYLSVQNEFPKTIFNDSWNEVFGTSKTTLSAVTELPYLVNLVHPTGIADQARIRSISRILNPKTTGSEGRRVGADLEAAARSMTPWEIYPGYFKDNPRYKLTANTTFVGAGTNYLDLGIPYDKFLEQVSGNLYVVVAERAAQQFTKYSAVGSGSNTRLTGVTPTPEIISSVTRQTVKLYSDNINQLIAGDSYVNATAMKSREYLVCIGLSGGENYIDFSISQSLNRLSSKYPGGLKNGVLVVGGKVLGTLALSSATLIGRAGTTDQRAIRITIPGNYSVYTGQPAAIVFSDNVPSPRVYERIVTPSGIIPLKVAGGSTYLITDVAILDGVNFVCNVLGSKVNAVLTIEIYQLGFDTKTLIGEIAIPANTSSGTLLSGNPTSVLAGGVYEAVYTGMAVSENSFIKITGVPV